MYKQRYTEILEDDQKLARERERIALDRSIALMMQAETIGAPGSASSATAIAFTNKLWTLLVEDLAAPDNGLPAELKAQIVSIGIWILRELERVRSGEAKGFNDLIEVSKAIRDGLL